MSTELAAGKASKAIPGFEEMLMLCSDLGALITSGSKTLYC